MQDFDSAERAWERAQETQREAAEEREEREAAAAALRAFHRKLGDAIDELQEVSPSEAQSAAITFAKLADHHLDHDMWSAACRDLDKAAGLDDWWQTLADELPKLL
jgi:hypothetical protein